MYGNPAGAIREQPILITELGSGREICTAKAGPKTHISKVKNEISQATGISVHEILLCVKNHKYKDSDAVGMDIFRTESPELHMKQLSPEEAELDAKRQEAFERILGGTKLTLLEEDLRADPDIVLFAVEHTNPAELQHAADEVKNDRDTMVQALTINTTCMYYVAPELWNDKAFVKSAVQIDGLLLGAAVVPKKWCADTEVVVHACENHGYALQFASEELKNSRPVVLAAVNQRGVSLMYASEEMRSEYYIVLDAVRNNRMAIVHAMNGLREDEDIRRAAGQAPSRKKVDIEKSDRLKAKFHELDENGDGYLSYEELSKLLRKGNPDMSDDEMRLLYDQLDTHHDGKVDFHEFCDFIHTPTQA